MTGDATNLERRLRIHVRAREHWFRAVVTPGFEPMAVEELAEAGVPGATMAAPGVVTFQGRLESLWLILAQARIPGRVRMEIASFRASHPAELRHGLSRIPWELYLPAGIPPVEVSCRRSRIMHTGLVQEIVQDCVPGAGSGNVALLVRIEEDRCEVSVDAGGGLLHLRGEGRDNGKAPLRDTMAAAILRAASLKSCAHFHDPMTGSGTLASEAARWAWGRIPALSRHFACEQWPSFRPAAWNHMLSGWAESPGPRPRLCVTASDLNSDALLRAQRNFGLAGLLEADSLGRKIESRQGDFLTDPPPADSGLVVLNPPYGERLVTDAPLLFREIGRKLQNDYSGWRWAVVAPSGNLERALGLEPSARIPFRHGGLPVVLVIGGRLSGT